MALLGSLSFLLFTVDMDMNISSAFQSHLNLFFLLSLGVAVVRKHAIDAKVAPLNLFAAFH